MKAITSSAVKFQSVAEILTAIKNELEAGKINTKDEMAQKFDNGVRSLPIPLTEKVLLTQGFIEWQRKQLNVAYNNSPKLAEVGVPRLVTLIEGYYSESEKEKALRPKTDKSGKSKKQKEVPLLNEVTLTEMLLKLSELPFTSVKTLKATKEFSVNELSILASRAENGAYEYGYNEDQASRLVTLAAILSKDEGHAQYKAIHSQIVADHNEANLDTVLWEIVSGSLQKSGLLFKIESVLMQREEEKKAKELLAEQASKEKILAKFNLVI